MAELKKTVYDNSPLLLYITTYRHPFGRLKVSDETRTLGLPLQLLN